MQTKIEFHLMIVFKMSTPHTRPMNTQLFLKRINCSKVVYLTKHEKVNNC